MKSFILLICVVCAFANATSFLDIPEAKTEGQAIIQANELYSSFFKKGLGLELDLTLCGQELERPSRLIVDALNNVGGQEDLYEYILSAVKLRQGMKNMYRELQNCSKEWTIFQEGMDMLSRGLSEDLMILWATIRVIQNAEETFETAGQIIRILTDDQSVTFNELGGHAGFLVGTLLPLSQVYE